MIFCGLIDDGTPLCWGGGSAVGSEPDLVLESLSAGDDGVCGIDPLGGLHCWGNPIIVDSAPD